MQKFPRRGGLSAGVSKVSSWKTLRGQQPVGVKEGWFRRRGMDRVKEDIMVEGKKDEDHLLAVGVESSHNEKHKREWKIALRNWFIVS